MCNLYKILKIMHRVHYCSKEKQHLEVGIKTYIFNTLVYIYKWGLFNWNPSLAQKNYSKIYLQIIITIIKTQIPITYISKQIKETDIPMFHQSSYIYPVYCSWLKKCFYCWFKHSSVFFTFASESSLLLKLLSNG